jgi:hypothetical protein
VEQALASEAAVGSVTSTRYGYCHCYQEIGAGIVDTSQYSWIDSIMGNKSQDCICVYIIDSHQVTVALIPGRQDFAS